jgi:hypothetical protein
LQRNRDGRLKACLSTHPNKVGVKKDPRRLSEASSGLSFECVSFAKKQRRSSDISSEFSSGRVSFAKKQRRSFEGSYQ